MGFWLGTLIFFLIQVVVTISINLFDKRPNKGCVHLLCRAVISDQDKNDDYASAVSLGRLAGAEDTVAPEPQTASLHCLCRLSHLLAITSVAQCWLL